MKKVFSAVLAVALVLALSVNVFGFTPPRHEVPADGSPLVVQAVHFDLGGQGVAFNSLPVSQWAGAGQGPWETRPDDTGANIGPIVEESGGYYNVGWAQAGHWINYTVVFPVGGLYSVVASAASEPGVDFGVSIAGGAVTEATVATGGWTAYADVDFGTFEVAAGSRVVTLHFPEGDANVRHLTFTLVEARDDVVAPQTGDGLILYAVGAFFAAAGVLFVLRRKMKATK